MVDTHLKRCIVGMPHSSVVGCSTLAIFGRDVDDIALTNQYCWSDGRDLFDVTTQDLRKVLNKKTRTTPMATSANGVDTPLGTHLNTKSGVLLGNSTV